MNFMNKMERKFGRYAIPNLMYYIVILYAVGVLVQMMAPAFYIQYLMLDARAILHGQIWRVVTFMIWPPSGSLFFNLIAIYLYYNLGMTLERVWGTFRFNVYFFMGVIGHVLAALLIYIITGQVYILTTDYLNFSLFFAFAATFPEMQFYLFLYFRSRRSIWHFLMDSTSSMDSFSAACRRELRSLCLYLILSYTSSCPGGAV